MGFQDVSSTDGSWTRRADLASHQDRKVDRLGRWSRLGVQEVVREQGQGGRSPRLQRSHAAHLGRGEGRKGRKGQQGTDDLPGRTDGNQDSSRFLDTSIATVVIARVFLD